MALSHVIAPLSHPLTHSKRRPQVDQDYPFDFIARRRRPVINCETLSMRREEDVMTKADKGHGPGRLRAGIGAAALLAIAITAAPLQWAAAESPLPSDLALEAPGPEIAANAARYAGVWKGVWGDDALDGALAVTRIISDRELEAIYSWKVLPNGEAGYSQPFAVEIDGNRLILPTFRNGANVTYVLVEDELRGFYKLNGRTTKGLFYK